jgi:hypothetical protein
MAYRHQSIAEQQLRYENIGYETPPVARNRTPPTPRNRTPPQSRSPPAARNRTPPQSRSPPAARNRTPPTPVARNRTPPRQQAAHIPHDYDECINYKCEIAKLKLELKIAKGGEITDNDIEQLNANIREYCPEDDDVDTFIENMEIERQIVKLKNEVNTIKFVLPFICHFLFIIIGNRKFDGLTNLTDLYSVLLYTAPKTVNSITQTTKQTAIIAKQLAFRGANNVKEKLRIIIPEFVRYIQRGLGYHQYSATYLTVFLLIIYYIVAGQQITNIDSVKPFSEKPKIANRKPTTVAQKKRELNFVKEKDKAIYRIATTYMNDDELSELAYIFIDKLKVKMFLKKLRNKINTNINDLTNKEAIAAKLVGQDTLQSRKELAEIDFERMLMIDDIEQLNKAIGSFKGGKSSKKTKVSKKRFI